VPDDAAWLTPGDAVVAAGAATDTAGQAAGLWQSLKAAWLARDAGEVNRLADEFAEAATSRPGYPSAARRKVELLYNRSRYGTIAFVGFAVAVAMLLPGAGAGRRNWRRTGLEVLAASTIVLAGGFAARWMLSGRPWYLPPIMNQFEAVTGSALLAAMVALVLEWRRGGGWFALAAALYATVALLAGFFLPATMGATVSAAHGILHSPLMAVHVAIIIVGHAMVGMAAVVSVAFLLAGAARRRSALGPIDRTNLVLVQLAAWLVTLGTVLGAVWGDFAWGRWWGWDPKETWALMTAIIFIGIVHLRLVVPARHRGWATAVACLVGAAVMLFNWIGVNYFLTGLHSYA
jgi:ABC-type transport system involved in cytochrome c biogenesis permease subunit